MAARTNGSMRCNLVHVTAIQIYTLKCKTGDSMVLCAGNVTPTVRVLAGRPHGEFCWLPIES